MNMQKMMKNMQKLQGKMTRVQAELEEKVFEANAGGGMVTIEMNGKYELQNIKLNPDAVDPDDVEALEDLILAAYHNVKSQIDAESQEKLGGLTQGMKLPGM
ncbi:MAG: YbaB/EbfC family nucleoid-associated protein [Fibrobacteria bacterium]|nr:YbaB/EbfC family nucleoid-associated protein [Fibrobacteria bacterium]